jgi:hypothetical protein
MVKTRTRGKPEPSSTHELSHVKVLELEVKVRFIHCGEFQSLNGRIDCKRLQIDSPCGHLQWAESHAVRTALRPRPKEASSCSGFVVPREVRWYIGLTATPRKASIRYVRVVGSNRQHKEHVAVGGCNVSSAGIYHVLGVWRTRMSAVARSHCNRPSAQS